MSGGASEEDLDDVDIPEDEYLFEIVERAPASSSLLNVMRETPASGAATDASPARHTPARRGSPATACRRGATRVGVRNDRAPLASGAGLFAVTRSENKFLLFLVVFLIEISSWR